MIAALLPLVFLSLCVGCTSECPWDCAQCDPQGHCQERFSCSARLPCPSRTSPVEPCARLVCRQGECLASDAFCQQRQLSATTPGPVQGTPGGTEMVGIITGLILLAACLTAFFVATCWCE